MQPILNDLGGCRRELKVEYSEQEVEAKYGEVLDEYVKYGRVNGFRPGHAPEAMIRRQYGKQIAKDVRDRLFGEGYRAALAKLEFFPVADIDFHEDAIEVGKPYSFTLKMEVAPKPEISGYKGIALEAKKIDIADEAVDQMIDMARHQAGKYEDVADGTAAAAEDIVSLDYTGTLDGHPVDEGLGDSAKSLASAKDFFARAGDFPSPLPGLGPKLVGMVPGEARDIEIAFPDDFRIEGLRGKTASYSVTVKKLRRLVPHALDEEFFKTNGAKDEADLRAKVREALEHQALDDAARAAEDALNKALLACPGADFDLPDSEVESEKNSLVYRIVQENARRGIPEDEIRKHIDDITANAEKTARETLRLRYIVDAIAKAEKISVSTRELRDWLRAQTGDADAFVRDMAKKQKTTEDAVRAEIRATIRRTRTERFLLRNAAWSGDGVDALRKHMSAEAQDIPEGDGAEA